MQIGWIDFSQKERNKIVSILKMLGTQTALDELGIGVVRDAFSELLFPGTSVLQTRAKYFVLIPYIFEDAIKQNYSTKREYEKYIKDREDTLIKVLSKNSPGEGGIIGIRSGTAKNMPRNIYWNSLKAFEILRDSTCSLDSAIGFVYNKSRQIHSISLKEEGNDTAADDLDELRRNSVLFDPINPKYNYMKTANIYPTKKEAEYLLHHFTHAYRVKGSLMAHMLNNPDKYFGRDEKGNRCCLYSFWDIKEDGLPEDIRINLKYAKQFSDFIYGAHLLYNIIFAEGCEASDQIIDIKAEYDNWLENYRSPDLDSIIKITDCRPDVSFFLNRWDEASRTKDNALARKTVIEREIQVKPGRAKLNHPDHYQFQKPIHYFRLSYRYGTAVTLLRDILIGLNAGE